MELNDLLISLSVILIIYFVFRKFNFSKSPNNLVLFFSSSNSNGGTRFAKSLLFFESMV